MVAAAFPHTLPYYVDERSDRSSGIFESTDLDRLRWSSLDARIAGALERIAEAGRLATDKNLRDATTATTRIRLWCNELAASRLIDGRVRALLSRTYRWTAMLADDLADVAEGAPRGGAFPLGAYAELAATCFIEEVAGYRELPLLAALERDLRFLLLAVRA